MQYWGYKLEAIQIGKTNNKGYRLPNDFYQNLHNISKILKAVSLITKFFLMALILHIRTPTFQENFIISSKFLLLKKLEQENYSIFKNINYFIVVLNILKNTLSIIELRFDKQYRIAMATTIATGRCTVLQLR